MAGSVLGSEVRWIEVSPGYYDAVRRRAVKGLQPAFAIILVGALLLQFVFGVDVLSDRRVRGMLFALGAGMVLSLAIIPFAKRIAKSQVEGYRLGASSAGLHFELSKNQAPFGMGRSGRVAWRDVWFDGKRLLAGRKTLMVSTPRGDALFDAEDLRREIVAHIPRANLITPSQMMLRMLFPGGPMGALFIVLAVGAIVAFLIAHL
jgi:hypothetical protein